MLNVFRKNKSVPLVSLQTHHFQEEGTADRKGEIGKSGPSPAAPPQPHSGDSPQQIIKDTFLNVGPRRHLGLLARMLEKKSVGPFINSDLVSRLHCLGSSW